MEFIDKVRTILSDIKELNNPEIELVYDKQKNISGHIADSYFSKITDEESQQLIWNALKNNLEGDERVRIIAIFHETPIERQDRINGYRDQKKIDSHYWVHNAPDLSRFWLFVDVAKIGDDYKSYYMVICAKIHRNAPTTFVYNKEIIDFMELKPEEIYPELFQTAFGNGEADIKAVLMNSYDGLTQKGLWGKESNPYWYVFADFKMKPVDKSHLIFTQEEIDLINLQLKHFKDFSTYETLSNAIKISELINKNKSNLPSS